MAASVDTSEGTGEGVKNKNEDNIIKSLTELLKKQKLYYIADIAMKVEEESLSDLIQYSRSDLTELLADIHNDESNEYKIKVSHRNKFAKIMMEKKKELLEIQTPIATATTLSQVKVFLPIFLGKEEEEAIEIIQSGKQFMDTAINKMKESVNNLDENNTQIKQNLDNICIALKQRIDEKQKEIVSMLDTVHKYHSNGLNKKNEITQQSSKVVDKFYNDYESYFTDDKMTKSDRKDKLLAVKNGITVECDKIKKMNEVTYNMEVELNKDCVDQFFDQFVALKNIGIELPAVQNAERDGQFIKWKPPKLNDDIIALFKQTDDDNKEETQLSIVYQVLYTQEKGQDDEKKDDVVWNTLVVKNEENRYNMKDYMPCIAGVQYKINNMLQSPICSQVEMRYQAKWSSEHLGKGLVLSENNMKVLNEQGAQTARAKFPIKKGMLVKLNYTFYCPSSVCYETVAVISSQYNGDYSNVTVPWNDNNLVQYTYGIMSSGGSQQFYGKKLDVGWKCMINTGSETTIQMVVDYTKDDSCLLTFYNEGTFKGPSNQTYSMKLPAGHEWYPIVCFDYDQNWCKIECVD